MPDKPTDPDFVNAILTLAANDAHAYHTRDPRAALTRALYEYQRQRRDHERADYAACRHELAAILRQRWEGCDHPDARHRAHADGTDRLWCPDCDEYLTD